MNNNSIDFTLEEINFLANAFVDTLLLSNETNIHIYEIQVDTFITNKVLEHSATSFGGITDPLGQLRDWFVNVLNSIASWIVSGIQGFIQQYVIPVINNIQGFINNIVNVLGEVRNRIISGLGEITSFLNNLSQAVSQAIRSAVDTIVNSIKSIGDQVQSGLSTIGSKLGDVWNYLTDIADKIGKGFEAISHTLAGFVNSIGQGFSWLIEQIQSGLETIGKWFKPVVDFFTAIGTGFQEFVKDPLGTLNKYVVQPVLGGLNWIWNQLVKLGEFIVNGLKALGEWIWSGLVGLGTTIVNIVVAGVQGLVSTIKALGEKVSGFIGGLFTEFISGIVKPITGYIHELIERVKRGEGRGEITEFTGLIGAIVFAVLGHRLILRGFEALANMLKGLNFRVELSLKPLGVGGAKTITIPINIGEAVRSFIDELKFYGEKLVESMFLGLAIWFTRPISRVLNSTFRNYLPVELPTENTMLEFTRRLLPTQVFKEVYSNTKMFLALYGYSDMVIDWFLASGEKYSITIIDRFGKERTIPLSLLYELPSKEDVSLMMVRDIIQEYESFTRFFLARGLVPDISALYYLLRFKYPSPEKLWIFTMRGISGLLWYKPGREEIEEAKRELERIGLPPTGEYAKYIPIAPADLNFNAEKLLQAYSTYMKWHDLSRISWIKEFTSDNMIVIDVNADIPGRIDQRWMVKWGLYELLSSKKVDITSPVRDFAVKIVEQTPASSIVLDLTNFSRTLQSTGLHPYWIPLVSVAETINVLTEERTLLRTGFLSLFKEGFWSIEAVEVFLSGFIKTSFRIAYFDIEDRRWKTGWINVPVMYLPPERKMLELRGLIDRALDVLREIQRDLIVAYQEFIVVDYTEFRAKLEYVINKVNEFFTRDYEKITGQKLPAELQLKFIEEYYKPLVQGLEIWREVFTTRRIRLTSQRILGWIIYRLSTGVITREEVEHVLSVITRYSKLTEIEKQFLSELMEAMYGIAIREYIPTPQQLASLSEYIVIPEKLIDEALEKRFVPLEWRKLWKQYITIRPLVDDLKRYLNIVKDMYEYFAIDEKKLVEAIEKIAPYLGLERREIEIQKMIAKYQRIFRAFKELLGDIDKLMTISEYSPKAIDYFTGLLDEMIKELPISESEKKEIREMWIQYLYGRLYKSEARSFITALIASYVKGRITRETLHKLLDSMKQYGFHDKEIEFYKAIADLRRGYGIEVVETE